MSIGLTRYSGKMYAFINFASAIFWASLTIVPVYIYGEEILGLFNWVKAFVGEHWYLAIAFALTMLALIYGFFHHNTKPKRKGTRREA